MVSKKASFTPEQRKEFYSAIDVINRQFGRQIGKTEKWAFFMIVAYCFLTGIIIYGGFIIPLNNYVNDNIPQDTDALFEAAGYEKICVEWDVDHEKFLWSSTGFYNCVFSCDGIECIDECMDKIPRECIRQVWFPPQLNDAPSPSKG